MTGGVNLEKDLSATASLLTDATTGTLLGPPLSKDGTGEAYMNSEIPDGIDSEYIMQILRKGNEIKVNVEYLDKMPEEFENEAIVWKKHS